jgi:hypothetical protein
MNAGKTTMYAISCWSRNENDEQVMRRITLGDLRVFAATNSREDIADRLTALEHRGTRYSYEDVDVLGAAWTALGWPRIGTVVAASGIGGI